MATVIQGKDMLIFVRRYADRNSQDGTKIKFQTEHSITQEKESESTVTKDGNVTTVSDGENTADITSLAYREDTDVIAGWKDMRSMFKNNELVELWQVDMESAQNGTDVEVDYFQGFFTSFELSAAADATVELTYTFTINGNGVEGTDTLSQEQLSEARSAQYEYQQIQAADGSTSESGA